MNEERLHKTINAHQMRAVDFWERGGRKSKAKALREAGYSEAVARQPHKVFDSPAVKQELERRGYGPTGVKAGLQSQPRLRDIKAEQNTKLFKALVADLDGLKKALSSVPYIPKPQLEEDRSGISYRRDLDLEGNILTQGNNLANTGNFSSM